MSSLMKKFISEKDAETKKKNQEAEGISEAPYDARSLYDRLQDEKNRKQEEYEATSSLKNRIHRLDEEEVEYLQSLAVKQHKTEIDQEKEVAELVREAKVSRTIVPTAPSNDSHQKISQISYKSNPSQRALMANAVKRTSGIIDSNSNPKPKRPNTRIDDPNSTNATGKPSQNNTNNPSPHTGSMCQTGLQPIATLPGLTEYSSSDSDDSTRSDADSTDVEDAVCTLAAVAKSRTRKMKTNSEEDE